MLAPAALSPAIVNRLNRDIAAIQRMDEVQKRFAAEAAETITMTQPELRAFIAQEMAKWARVANEAGIKGE